MQVRDGTKGIADLSPERRELLLRRLREKQPPKARLDTSLPVLVPDPEHRHEPFPLSDVQQSYLAGRSGFFDLGTGGTNVYEELEFSWGHQATLDRINVAFQRLVRRWRGRGFLDLDAYKTNYLHRRLNHSLQRMIARHEMLRVIVLPDGQQQILATVPPYHIDVIDLRGKDAQTVEAERERVRTWMRTTKGDVGRWPLFDVLAHRLDGERLRLHIRIESLLLDGFGRAVFVRELLQHLGEPHLPVLECSYRDYVLTWLAFQEGELYQRAREYWMQRIPTLPKAPELPLTQMITTTTPSPFGSRMLTLLEPERWQRLKTRAAQVDLTPSGVVAAAFVEILTTWSAQAHFLLSMLGTDRPPIHAQINQVIGSFHTIHLLEVEHAPGSFEERAKRLQRQMLFDLEHRIFSGFQVLRELKRYQRGGSRALMPILFNSVIEYSHPSYQHIVGGGGGSSANAMLAFKETDTGMHLPQVLLLPTHSESDAGALMCKWQAVEHMFPAGLLDDMIASYVRLLERLADEDAVWGAMSLELVPPAHLQQRAAINATAAPIPSGLLHSLFIAQAHVSPYQMAVIAADRSFTYAELARHVTQLSRRLQDVGVGTNTVVGVVMDRGWEQIVAVLAILQAGGAYLPLDVGVSAAFLRAAFKQTKVTLVLTQSWLTGAFAWPEGVARLAVDTVAWEDVREHPLEAVQGQEDVACVIAREAAGGVFYGVRVDHRGAVNTLLDVNRRFAVGSDDRVVALAPLSSDLAMYDIFGVLAAGGSIVVPAAASERDPAYLAELMVREQVTIWNAPSALLDQQLLFMAGQPECTLDDLRLVLVSRDRVSRMLPMRLAAVAARAQLVSLGGATEASIWSACAPIVAGVLGEEGVPYGRPLANQRVHVLNALLEPCPVWVSGQMYIGGIGLSKGYWNDVERTRARFITHPRTGERLYRTGDVGRYLPDGTIVVQGSEQDRAVMVHGEPLDAQRIESMIEEHPAVCRAVVRVHEDAAANQHVFVYQVSSQERAPSLSELRYFLRMRVPDYVVPSGAMQLAAFPLTPSGTIDRAALPLPGDDGWARPRGFVAPRDALEEQILRVWEDFFPMRPLGVRDNFFDIGGSSLLAARLLSRVRELFGADLPLALFLHEATVEHLARILRDAPIEQMAQTLRQQPISLRQAPVALPQLTMAKLAPEPKGAEVTAVAERVAPPGMRTFFVIWLGQLITLLGSGLTGFAMGVWVYQRTGSATQLTLISFFTMLPMVIFSPVAGALVDRWDRRWALIVSEAGAALTPLLLIFLVLSDRFTIWPIYVIVGISSVFRAFQFPAFSAATTLLVPKEQLTRASGMAQIAQGIGQLLAPVLAGVLLSATSLWVVFLVDAITFVLSLATLVYVRIPRPETSAEGMASRGSLWRESTYGWTYIRQRPGLLSLLLFFAASNFLMGTIIVLAPPLLLSFTTPAVLGTVLSVGGSGILVGSVVMSIWGGPRRRVYGVFGGVLLAGVGMILAGLAPFAPLIGLAAFVLTFGLPMITASSQAIWQRKVAPDVQGRVFAIRSMIATASMPLAFLVSGPLADYVFQPMLVRGGLLAGTIGRVIGTGPGRGIGLMFVVLGVLALVAVGVGYMYPRLRMVEEDLPDAIPDSTPVSVSANGQGPSVV